MAAGPRVKRIEVILEGTYDVMFDRYAGDNTTALEPWQKLYFGAQWAIVLPAKNLMSFLAAQNTDSAAKRFIDKRKFKDVASVINAYVQIHPPRIPFIREDGSPITFGKLERLNGQDVDPKSGVYIDYDVARLAKGIPNPKVRPVLPVPWSLAFGLSLYENATVNEQMLANLFERGGQAIGLGTHRGIYGKFTVAHWAEASAPR